MLQCSIEILEDRFGVSAAAPVTWSQGRSMPNLDESHNRITRPAPKRGARAESHLDGDVSISALAGDGVAPRPVAGGDDPAPSLFARQVRMAYGLLQTAIEDAADSVETQNVKLAAELEDLQTRALRSIRDSALATIDLLEALGAVPTPGELASRQIELARRQRASVNERLAEFFASARKMASLMTDPLDRHLRSLSAAMAPADRGPPEAGDTMLARLNRLTARQKKVLELLAEGLPNKVIAHELGISETTVKAHVGEILRKLKVYNRARAIVMLAQFDMAQIRALSSGGD
jgi:DNA-binding CsgD family transcriptional regulator